VVSISEGSWIYGPDFTASEARVLGIKNIEEFTKKWNCHALALPFIGQLADHIPHESSYLENVHALPGPRKLGLGGISGA
jgi:hypothetical protein